MVITELNRDGAEKYVISLKGPLDGLRFDVLYFSNGEMVSRLIDEESGAEVEAIQLKTELYGTEEGMVGLRIDQKGNNARGVVLAWDDEIEPLTNRYERGTKLALTGLGYRDELLYLTTWWLIQNRAMEVNICDWIRIKKDDEGLKGLERLFLAESKMEAFYAGDEVCLSDGLILKVDCNAKKDRGFKLAVSMKNEKDYVAWIEGEVERTPEGLYRLIVSSWINDWDKDNQNIELDLLAFCQRFMKYKFLDYEIVDDGYRVSLLDEVVSERTGWWLGF